jgi:hypothetical protein
MLSSSLTTRLNEGSPRPARLDPRARRAGGDGRFRAGASLSGHMSDSGGPGRRPPSKRSDHWNAFLAEPPATRHSAGEEALEGNVSELERGAER